MFERFRKSNAPADEPGAVAVRHRDEAPPDDATTVQEAETRRPMTDDARATGVGDRPADDDPRFTREPGRTTDDDGAATAVAERERGYRMAPVVGDDALAEMHARQRDRYGGVRWGSAFFGLLSAVGLASILLAIVVAAGVAIGVSEVKDTANGTNDTIGVGGGIVLLCVLATAWYCGGYVAGRMARFDGVRQGLGVWAWTVLFAAAVAILGAIGGEEYNVLQQLNLPNIAVGGASLTTGGIVAGLCALVVTLLAAVLGGKAGDRFHRRVDRLAAREYESAI